ncbi:LemA protein [Streptohalobacillus salinus]|uniref:LemA protein n=1 Tax=Streptohalobacillus salinus TaxID=621096 RepID=A0A2V3VZ73_9BACI|nr:LemA family protein [Streptohalobacillus salinus]PXW87337.1 LemA protein [Streptohalobacillus salinus]
MTGWIIGGVVVLVIIILIGWVISTYNRLVSTRELVENAMGQISTQIESRWDALKSMIDGTKRYEKHEAEVLEGITEKRSQIGKGAEVSDVNQDDQLFNQALGRLIAVAENYPDLKASTVYQDTLRNIDKYENQVRQSRMIYNDTVTKYNRIIQMVPSNIIAGMFNFTKRDYFEGTQEKTEMPSWG